MSGRLRKLSVVDDQDDAAFRARLAPLASEVLPPSAVAPPRARPSDGGRRRIGLWVVAGMTGLMGAAWLGSQRRWTTPRVAAGPPPGASMPVATASGRAGPETVNTAARMDPAMARRPLGPAAAESADVAEKSRPPLPGVPERDDDMIWLLLRRGDSALAEGDIAAARLLYGQAAALGSAAGAAAAGKTYDADFLPRTGVRGTQPDLTAAARWYRKAAALGDVEARTRLARIESRPGP